MPFFFALDNFVICSFDNPVNLDISAVDSPSLIDVFAIFIFSSIWPSFFPLLNNFASSI